MHGRWTAWCSTPGNAGSLGKRKENAMFTPVRSLSIFALLLLTSFNSLSAEPTIELGREVHVQAVICDSKDKAEAVIKAHAEQGIEKATHIAGATCLSARFIGTPTLVLATRPLGDQVLKVIQVQVRMADNTHTTWFLPTWYPINGGAMT